MEKRLRWLGRLFAVAGVAVMALPAVVHIAYPPAAVCLVVCGIFLLGYGRENF